MYGIVTLTPIIMKRTNPSFAERLRRGDLLIGTLVSLPSPEITEILAGCGFDWLFIVTADHRCPDLLSYPVRRLQKNRRNLCKTWFCPLYYHEHAYANRIRRGNQ